MALPSPFLSSGLIFLRCALWFLRAERLGSPQAETFLAQPHLDTH